MMFGEELRRRRIAANMSLATLAKNVHYSKGHLSKIENGAKIPAPGLARRCDTVFDAGGELAALAPDRTRPEAPTEKSFDDEGEVWSMVLLPDGTSSFQPMARREAVLAGAVSLLGLSARPRSAAAQARMENTLPHYSALFDHTRHMGQLLSPGTLLPTLITQAHSLSGIAKHSRGPLRDDMLRLSSRYAEYAGWMAQEAGNDRAALWWTGKAVEFAEEGGDPHLQAYAMVRRALITLYRDDSVQTIELARRAQADPATPARIRGLAAQREAQGHALAGDYDSCRRALDRAAELLSTTPGGGASPTAGPVIGTATLSDPAAMVTGWCLHELGHFDEAIRILSREIAKIPRDAVRSRTRYGARLALTYAEAGEIEKACELTEGLLADADVVESATITSDLRRIARALARRRRHPHVRQIYPQLTSSLQTMDI
ncbi:helix-turn-helix domain-containing protein [Streptomyces sp. NPDC048288]|uniref:helix-turn-helix domain-containing protein n=1 Tax=Streptomyces sp. NPDC048288 TaxID=3365529 RepID=UPI003712B34D